MGRNSDGGGGGRNSDGEGGGRGEEKRIVVAPSLRKQSHY